ncbi:MAG: hypothetical protein H8E60_11090 [Candidatus Marinimicrobia bacterium]|nr:hypothetical protein [Candidatus Neomarinimicrobiota bacterium]
MDIYCQSCKNTNKRFLLPIWNKTTFKIETDGDIKLLHLSPLESLEDKIADNHVKKDIICRGCSSNDIKIILNEYEDDDERNALNGL